ncbi:MAG: thiolase family protein [Desulfuromonadaceae bacterium]|nr:thiolase family protein [Desulfuromonadaceae bacterium]MDD2855716.1 thiolase family protein [Desulfuromonadaceae bacterium]
MQTQFRPRPVYIAASWMAPVGRYTGMEKQKLSFLELAEWGGDVFKDSSVRLRDIEAVIVGSQNPSAFSSVDNTAAKISGILGISGTHSVLIDTASSSGASAFENAYLEIASGRYDSVLAIGVQKMSDASTAESTRIIAGVIDRNEAEYGLSMPACGALVARALKEKLGFNDEEWTAYSALLTQRSQRFAAVNPDAHLNMQIELGDYYQQIVNGRNYPYWYPLRYHDFCPMSDGVAAVVLTSKKQDVRVSGVGSATDIPTIADRNYFHSFPATVIAAGYAYGMAGIKNIRSFAGKIHVNMHDPFNGFGPINMVDLGIVSRNRLMDALLDDSLTGENGAFPTNLTGGLKGRGHPLGATGMIQIVENHRLINERGFAAALSHSIGGPINNNVVTLLERTENFENRSHEVFKPWGMPSLGRMKPKDINLDSLLASSGAVKGVFVSSTVRFHYKTGAPEVVILIVACRFEGRLYKFLFGISGESCQQISGYSTGENVLIEGVNGSLLVNSMPVMKLYTRTVNGLIEMAGSSWKKLTGKI